MNSHNVQDFRSPPYQRVYLVLAFLLVVGLVTAGDYGISWDEKTEIDMVFRNVRFVSYGEPISRDLRHYGTLFNFVSEAVFQIKSIITGNDADWVTISRELDHPKAREEFLDRIQVKHRLTFLLSLVAYASVAGIVGTLAGARFAWLGPLTLALFPRYWGHSFFNPKDIPFAAMFTLGTFLGALLIGYVLRQNHQRLRVGANRLTLAFLGFGVFVGLATGTRIGAFLLIPFVALTHGVTVFAMRRSLKQGLHFLGYYGLMLIAWFVTMAAIHPASWSNPALWFIQTLRYLSHHAWDGVVLFAGSYISGRDTPWYYVAQWLGITTPVVLTVLSVAGFVLALRRYRNFDGTAKACLLLVILQMSFLPVIAILSGSAIYDEIRQFLFVIPAMASFSAAAVAWIYQGFPARSFRLPFVGLLIVAAGLIVFDMASLHPYEYVYFNRLFGGLEKARGAYETDYWGLSMREGMEWINQNAGGSPSVVSSYPLASSEPFATPGMAVLSLKEYDQKGLQRPYYYIAIPRMQFQDRFPECATVYQVIRQATPLTIVKRCDP